jgi:hypothetical protein
MVGIIPLMGIGSRFLKAGITCPKHLLPFSLHKDDKPEPFISLILKSFYPHPVYIGCRISYYDALFDLVKNNPDFSQRVFLFTIDEYPVPPAKAVRILLSHVHTNTEIIVNYCDVLLPVGLDVLYRAAKWKGSSAAMVGVETEESRFTRDVKYNLAIGGVYYFKEKNDLLRRLEGLPPEVTMGEVVQKSRYDMIKVRQIDIGTPESYEKYIAGDNKDST